jgi:hypothetical protein
MKAGASYSLIEIVLAVALLVVIVGIAVMGSQ